MTVRVLGAAVAIWVVLSVSLWSSGWDPAVLVLGGIVVVAAVLLFVAVDLVRDVEHVTWPDPNNNQSSLGGREDDRVLTLLGAAHQPDWTDATDVRTSLLGVLDDRLHANHGVDRAADPEAADDLLTPRLRQLVAGPSNRLSRPSELRSVLSDLEEL